MRIFKITLFLLVFSTAIFGQIRQSKKAIVDAEKIDYSAPQEFEIGGIRVEGPDFLDPNTLISLTGLRVGDRVKIPGEEISNAITRLWKHGLVDNVIIYKEKIEEGKVYLVISLTERPRLRKFEFSGINRTQEKEISDNISLYRGKVLTDAIIKNTELTVSKYFIDKGFLNTEVTIRQKMDTVLENHVILEVNIDKKQKEI